MAISVRMRGGFCRLFFASSITFGMYVMRWAALAVFRSFGSVDCVKSVKTESEMYSPKTRGSLANRESCSACQRPNFRACCQISKSI